MAKIKYTAKGTDAATIVTSAGTHTSGTVTDFPQLIGYPGSGQITYPDGREFPRVTAQGSTFVLQ